MIHVIALITTQSGRRDEVLDLFRANRRNVLAEVGCVEYQATVDLQPGLAKQTPLGPDTFAVIEKWESPEALQDHFKAPHMAAYAEATQGLVVSRSIHVLSEA